MASGLPTRHLLERVVVALPTEIDLGNAEEIRAKVPGLFDARPRVVVDTTGTAFCDSSGGNALVHACQRARSQDSWVRLVVTRQHVRKVFTTGVDQVIPVHPSLGDALVEVPAADEPAPASKRTHRRR